MAGTLSDFKTVVGKVKLENDSSSDSCSVKELIFSLKVTEDSMKCVVSDFRSSPLIGNFSESSLREKKERIGITGSFEEFLLWMHRAFSSDLVKFCPRRDQSSSCSNGTLIGQRCQGEPLIRLEVMAVEGEAGKSDVAALGFNLFYQCKEQEMELLKERTESGKLASCLTAERALSRDFEERLLELEDRGLAGRRKRRQLSPRRSLSHRLSEESQLLGGGSIPALSDTQSLGSQAETISELGPHSQPAGGNPEIVGEAQKKKGQNQGGFSRRVRRPKAKSTTIGDEDVT